MLSLFGIVSVTLMRNEKVRSNSHLFLCSFLVKNSTWQVFSLTIIASMRLYMKGLKPLTTRIVYNKGLDRELSGLNIHRLCCGICPKLILYRCGLVSELSGWNSHYVVEFGCWACRNMPKHFIYIDANWWVSCLVEIHIDYVVELAQTDTCCYRFFKSFFIYNPCSYRFLKSFFIYNPCSLVLEKTCESSIK